MITGCHSLIYSKQPEQVRAFFKDVLGMKHVDAGQGWLIFALPPAELAVHPAEDDETHVEFYLICDNVKATVADLEKKGVEFGRPISDQGWGWLTTIRMPDGSELGLYQPKHPTALGMK